MPKLFLIFGIFLFHIPMISSIFKKIIIKNSQSKERLYTHEWLTILFLISLLLLLSFVSHSCEPSFPEIGEKVYHLKKQEFEVTIEGEVELPGKYSVKRGFKIEDLLLLAKPKASADLGRIKKQALVKNKQKIKIPALQMVKIILKFEDGAIDEISLPKGSKWEDLLKVYPWKEGVDLSFLEKKRRLKNEEVIKIKFNK